LKIKPSTTAVLAVLVVVLCGLATVGGIRNHLWRGSSPDLTGAAVALPDDVAARSWDRQPVAYTADILGINLPWLDLHNGSDGKWALDWLGATYDQRLVEADLAEIEAMGIRKIRSFCVMESVFDFRQGAFRLNGAPARNLDDFLDRAERHGIAVICVMGDGNDDGEPGKPDGKFRWALIQSPEGRRAYVDAYVAYVERFRGHRNILMWDVHNEPYGELTWSPAARGLNVTQEQVHQYLLASYTALKAIAGDVPVGFSEMEEKEQPRYRIFGDDAKRRALIDDCTDVYAMHIYRASPDQIEDFRRLTGKPKWAVELGAYNYSDPDASGHPIPARNELYDAEKNYRAVVPMAQKLVNSGFTLILPWGFSSNPGVVTHNPDGSHTLGPLARFIRTELTGVGTGAK
jgi:hypothetical protein